jgi:preprotein translocase subunit SecE
VSREIAGSKANTGGSESSLTSELFHASTYKPTQGRIVRQLTVLAIGLIVALGCWSLYTTLSNSDQSLSLAIVVGVPAVLLVVGLWISYRLINWPRFADFLIAVEAEMKKVTWPSREEVKRASVVVIVTIAILAVSLFLFDVVWHGFFNALWATA